VENGEFGEILYFLGRFLRFFDHKRPKKKKKNRTNPVGAWKISLPILNTNPLPSQTKLHEKNPIPFARWRFRMIDPVGSSGFGGLVCRTFSSQASRVPAQKHPRPSVTDARSRFHGATVSASDIKNTRWSSPYRFFSLCQSC
jgi:hypothetical protein